MTRNELARSAGPSNAGTSNAGVSNVGPSNAGPSNYKPSAPDDWFVDPVRLGIPGLRPQVVEDDNPLAWQTDALCAQTDPEAFFPEKGGSTRDAKRICTTCEVKAQCLDYALQNDERFGIWGGLSERERRRLRRARSA
jgi:WhiB family redox-sensing transcriptional regulator